MIIVTGGAGLLHAYNFKIITNNNKQYLLI